MKVFTDARKKYFCDPVTPGNDVRIDGRALPPQWSAVHPPGFFMARLCRMQTAPMDMSAQPRTCGGLSVFLGMAALGRKLAMLADDDVWLARNSVAFSLSVTESSKRNCTPSSIKNT